MVAISVAVSSWTLVAISCERYYAICHPLRSRTWQTLNHAYRIIGFIWFGSILCMTPIAIFSQLMPTSRQGLRKCREQWPADSLAYERSYNIFLDLILLVLPLLILSFAYILITRTLYVGMQNERAMIFGSVASSAIAGGGGSGGGKLGNEVDALTTALVPNTTTTTKPASRFQFNVSFRVRGRSSISVGGDDYETTQERQHSMKKSTSQSRQLQQQQSLQEQQKKSVEQRQHCYDDVVPTPAMTATAITQKRKLLTATDGRRHLYCMGAGSIKSLNHNNNDRSGGLGGSSSSVSPSSSMTVINVPQQQRFKLYQQRHQSQQQLNQHQQQQQQQHQLQIYLEQDMERSKSTSTPSLRLHDTALRRSNKTKSLESKKRVIKMLFVLVLEFFICWTPLYVINTVAMFIGPAIYEYVDYTSISFFQLLAYSSSCCNPITYCFMNAGFRRAFLDTFKGIQLSGGFFRRKNSSNHSVAGNSIIMANSGTMMTTNTVLDSPRL
ncbi:cholecystokinin receptor type A-like [Anastrepha ludens]|uniref:cholecystokinin receptor type A-like n=1 Tax=Anastrepha ludens TaxID=28586 RepID=UPI0023B0FB76|nr:cholecystokinin receptor type A-like [Anastrepha ludens]